jgi:hypothetical protein
MAENFWLQDTAIEEDFPISSPRRLISILLAMLIA